MSYTVLSGEYTDVFEGIHVMNDVDKWIVRYFVTYGVTMYYCTDGTFDYSLITRCNLMCMCNAIKSVE